MAGRHHLERLGLARDVLGDRAALGIDQQRGDELGRVERDLLRTLRDRRDVAGRGGPDGQRHGVLGRQGPAGRHGSGGRSGAGRQGVVVRHGFADGRDVAVRHGHHVGEDDGDVVRPAGGVGRGDQLGERVGPVRDGDHPGQVRVVHQAAQPVGAQQQPVTGGGVDQTDVRVVVRGAVEHPQQQRAVRMGGGLLGGEPALVDQ
ncbi:hypothetical protein SDC9_135938 [bioreactor metagenome]|uniref:Uncharacterized protein n=1 Tax=bioreactor metagenome TaxID=1076179 RepID=A0A645DH81_9ZZZZ